MDGKCKLCFNTGNLVESHIIPESFYKNLYDSKNRYLPLHKDKSKKLTFKQKGHKEKLLCLKCENKLSVWENTFKRDLVDIGNDSSNFLEIVKINDHLTFVNNIRYDHFKQAILSIFWRLDVSKNDVFKKYNLGIYSEKIWNILNNDIKTSDEIYVITIDKCILDGKHLPDIMFLFPKTRFKKIFYITTNFNLGIYDNIICQ